MGMAAPAPSTEAASMERTAAAMSQWAERISERSRDVKDLNPSFTLLEVTSNSSGDGDNGTVKPKPWQRSEISSD